MSRSESHVPDLNAPSLAIDFQLFYLAANDVTILCPAAAVNDTGVVDGVTYTKRDRVGLDALVAAVPTDEDGLATSCTTGVTDMSELFGSFAASESKVSDPATFNPDLSGWDTSSVTNTSSMFFVRVPPCLLSLLPCRAGCRMSPVASTHPRSLHTHTRPWMNRREPLPSTSPSVTGPRAR